MFARDRRPACHWESARREPRPGGTPDRYPQMMPSTWTKLWVHYVFATKRRQHLLTPELCARLWPFLGGITRQYQCTSLEIGGISDHVHMLVLMKPTISPSDLMQQVKGRSSGWIHETFTGLRNFEWQEGFGGFAVSESGVERVRDYIKAQASHHERMDSRTEFLRLLESHGLTPSDEHAIE
jgi:putative transposase